MVKQHILNIHKRILADDCQSFCNSGMRCQTKAEDGMLLGRRTSISAGITDKLDTLQAYFYPPMEMTRIV